MNENDLRTDQTLINAASLRPEPDEGCPSTCYYGGWSWDHAHDEEPPLEQ